MIVQTPAQKPSPSCLTCYGTGEVASENGPETCPDCFGAAAKLSQHTKNEWRLSALEQAYREQKRIAEMLQRSLLIKESPDAYPGIKVATFY